MKREKNNIFKTFVSFENYTFGLFTVPENRIKIFVNFIFAQQKEYKETIGCEIRFWQSLS